MVRILRIGRSQFVIWLEELWHNKEGAEEGGVHNGSQKGQFSTKEKCPEPAEQPANSQCDQADHAYDGKYDDGGSYVDS